MAKVNCWQEFSPQTRVCAERCLISRTWLAGRLDLSLDGVADRCEIVGGSFFETIPEGADAYVMRAIIHDWDDKEAISILRTCRRAITPDARLLLVERVVEPPNEGPISKFSDLNMLVMLGALERSYEEYSELCQTAGFEMRGTKSRGLALPSHRGSSHLDHFVWDLAFTAAGARIRCALFT